jgi:hypothetical protein
VNGSIQENVTVESAYAESIAKSVQIPSNRYAKYEVVPSERVSSNRNFDPNQLTLEYVPPALGVKALVKFFMVKVALAIPIVKMPTSRLVVYESISLSRFWKLPSENWTWSVVENA